MAYPTKPTVPVVPPAPSRLSPGIDFIQKADAMMAYLPAQVQNNSETVDFNAAAVEACAATAMAGTLPPLTGHAGKFLAINSGATAVELMAPATAREALLAGTAMSGLPSAHANFGLLASIGWNYAKGAAEPLGQFWDSGVTSGGITATRTATGIDAATGEAWVDYALTGTMTAASANFGYISVAGSQHAATTGQTKTVSARFTTTGNVGTGARVFMFEIATTVGDSVIGAQAMSTKTMAMRSGTTTVRCGVQIGGAVGAVINGTVRVQGLQFEDGAARSMGRYREVTQGEALAGLGVNEVRLLMQAFTGTSAVDFTLPDATIYSHVKFIYDVQFVGGANTLGFRTAATVGGAFASGSTDYNNALAAAATTGTGGFGGNTTANFGIFASNAGDRCVGEVLLPGFAGTGRNKPALFRSVVLGATDRFETGMAMRISTSAVAAMRFLAGSGTITGEITMIGVLK